jgi:hypothetical protein
MPPSWALVLTLDNGAGVVHSAFTQRLSCAALAAAALASALCVGCEVLGIRLLALPITAEKGYHRL